VRHWEEINAMGELPGIIVVSNLITSFLNALARQQHENKLFQLLNGLDDDLDHRGVKSFS